MAKKYSRTRKPSRYPKRILWLFIILCILAFGGVIIARNVYDADLKPVSTSQETKIYVVAKGSDVKQIADGLETAKLIRSSWAFQLYVHSQDVASKLEAGTYALSPSQTIPEIVGIITGGKVTQNLVTILPGQRIDQIRASLINDGFAPQAVDHALDPSLYPDVPVLQLKPTNVNNLEGLLWPDSFERSPDTDPSVIIRESLLETEHYLTPDVQAAFASEGLSPYQGITLTSIILKEVGKASDQPQVAQVFLSRMKQGMKLGSDVTALYGSVNAGVAPDLNYDSPYNTLIHTGLPPTPISNINTSSLYAATHPSNTNWLYFVAGDNGNTYFSTSYQQQQSDKNNYCHKLCGQ
jgi:UPF0755 protein